MATRDGSLFVGSTLATVSAAGSVPYDIDKTVEQHRSLSRVQSLSTDFSCRPGQNDPKTTRDWL